MRRAQGSVYDEGEYRVVSLDFGMVNGRRVRKRRYVRRTGLKPRELDRAVQAALDELIAERDGKRSRSAERSLAEYLESWLEDIVAPDLRPKTARGYRDHVRRHIVPAIGDVPLRDLAGEHVLALRREMRRKGLSPSTVAGAQKVLSSALSHAVDELRIIEHNAAQMRGPKVPKRKITPYTVDQVRAFFTAAAGDPLFALFVVYFTTAIRQSEALGLIRPNVDLERGVLRVSHQLQREEGELRLVELKSDGSQRVIGLPAVTAEALRLHLDQQGFAQRKAGPLWRDPIPDLVFRTSRGTPIEARNVARSFKRILRAADLPDIRPHDMRHTVASLHGADGAGAGAIRDLLGHSSISITNIYTHGLPETQRVLAERMDAMLGFGSADGSADSKNLTGSGG